MQVPRSVQHAFARMRHVAPGRSIAGILAVLGLSLYSIAPTSAQVQTRGANPYGRMVDANNCLYGTTLTDAALTPMYFNTSGTPPNNGLPSTFFVLTNFANANLYATPAVSATLATSIAISAGDPNPLVNATVTGKNPYGDLLLARDGSIYGTCSTGSSQGVYRSNGTAYSTSGAGYVFRFIPNFGSPTTGTLQILASIDGSPHSGLVQDPNNANWFYGTTIYNPSAGTYGKVYRIDVSSYIAPTPSTPGNPAAVTVLHSFTSTDGANPMNGVTPVLETYVGHTQPSVVLYGTTVYGGTSNAGTIYRLINDGTDFRVIFNGVTGGSSYFWGGLTAQNNGQILWGCSLNPSVGAFYKITTGSASDTVAQTYVIPNPPFNGIWPTSTLALDRIDGSLWGCTYHGATMGGLPAYNGSLFCYRPTSTYQSLPIRPGSGTALVNNTAAPFTYEDGEQPCAGMIQGIGTDTQYYGPNCSGEANTVAHLGNIYRLDRSYNYYPIFDF